MGDFVSRGWDVGLLGKLETLLQEALSELIRSSALGKEAVAQAPFIALSFRPGVLGEYGLIAVALPSHDRVGRTFPLCVGTQWSSLDSIGMDWPSLGFARSLISEVQRCVDSQTQPDDLLAAVAALGGPGQYPPSFHGLVGDETLPRLGPDVKLVCIGGPVDVMPPAQVALCSLLSNASDILGISFGSTGDAQNFFACRRLESGAALASMFDGRWIERGWSYFGAPVPQTACEPPAVPNIDEDATRPLQRVIDMHAQASNSR